MKFGRLENLEDADLTLPADAPATKQLLGGNKVETPGVFIGCPVWTDKGYLGKIYPKDAKPKDYLYHYSRQFNAIELNGTHYNIPTVEAVHKWRDMVPPGFRFFPKFTNIISHSRDFGMEYQALDRFLEAIYEFGDHLGISFIQLPPHFGPARIEGLQKFLEALPVDMQFALEIRHPDWFADTEAKRAYFQMLESLHITAVITDAPGRRDVLHQRLTTTSAFIRFLGNNLHPTDYQRINEWVLRLKEWLDEGVGTVCFFMHQPEKHLCADLTSYMIQQLNSLCKLNLKAPTKLDNLGQIDLFD